MRAARVLVWRRRGFDDGGGPFRGVEDHLMVLFDRLDFVTILTQGRARGYPLEGLVHCASTS